MKKKIVFIFMPALIMGVFTAFAASIQQPLSEEKDKSVQTPAQQPPAKAAEVQVQPDKIVPGPKNIKERTAIYVFVGWLWAAIVVLIYITRLEIKEADRLLELKFYRNEKK